MKQFTYVAKLMMYCTIFCFQGESGGVDYAFCAAQCSPWFPSTTCHGSCSSVWL